MTMLGWSYLSHDPLHPLNILHSKTWSVDVVMSNKHQCLSHSLPDTHIPTDSESLLTDFRQNVLISHVFLMKHGVNWQTCYSLVFWLPLYMLNIQLHEDILERLRKRVIRHTPYVFYGESTIVVHWTMLSYVTTGCILPIGHSVLLPSIQTSLF